MSATESSDFNIRINESPSVSFTPSQTLKGIEKDITLAEQRQRQARSALSAARARASEATAAAEEAREAADTCKDKAAKEEAVEAAEKAESLAEQTTAEAAEAEEASRSADANIAELARELRKQHVRATADALIDEARATATANKEVCDETWRQIDQAKVDDAQYGPEMRRLEAKAAREEEALEQLELRDLIDPDFYRDEWTACHNPELMHGHGDLRGVGSGIDYFGPAPRVKGFKYPQETPPLPYGKGLRSVAKYKGTDRLVLDPKTGNERVVSIRRIELGDAAQGPGPLKAVHEAVYFVQTDSTTTTYARSRPTWVTERRLAKLEPGDPVPGGPHVGGFRGPGWSRRWPMNNSFDVNRRKAIKQLEREVQIEKTLEQRKMEAIANGGVREVGVAKRGAANTLVAPDKHQMRARASLHGLAQEIQGFHFPSQRHGKPAAAVAAQLAAQSARGANPMSTAPPPSPRPQTARPQTAAPPAAGTPRRGSRPTSAARRSVGVDAGGYVGMMESDVRQLQPPKLPPNCLPAGQPRPGSARRPSSPGRTPSRPFSATASVRAAAQSASRQPPNELPLGGGTLPLGGGTLPLGDEQMTPRRPSQDSARLYVAERERSQASQF